MVETTYDNNQRTGEKNGHDVEPSMGILFGWNLADSWGAELSLRYSTNKNDVGGVDKREHFINGNVSLHYYLITDALTSPKKFDLLPFVGAGIYTGLAVVPGDDTSTDKSLTVWGIGPSVSAGINMLAWKYFYSGIHVLYDVPHRTSQAQDISGTSTTIIRGGWQPQLGGMVTVGVLY